jgi:hypothetical protein
MPDEVYIAVISALIGAWVTYRFALKLVDAQATVTKEQSFIEAKRLAAANLHAAFHPVLFKILCNEIAMRDEIRREANTVFATQILEIGRFRFYVSLCDIPAYDEACKNYYVFIKSHAPIAETTPPGETPTLLTDSDRCEKFVNAILHFAKP